MTVTADRAAPAWDTVRRGRRGQALLVTLGVLALVPSALAAALRLFPPTADAPALLASFVPYGIVGWLICTLCFVVAAVRGRGRRPALVVLSLIAIAGLTYQGATLAPLFIPDGRPASTRPLTVFSLNMQHGYADPARLTTAVQDADIVVLVEATPIAVQRLDERGWQQRFPYVSGATADGGNGSVVYSRYPLQDSEALPMSSFQQWMTTVEVPQIGAVRLLAVHPCNPLCGGDSWAREQAELRRLARTYESEPLIMAGDFNAIDDHGPMINLRRDGMRSATDVAGAGWLPTWPANKRLPPMIPIDHVLVNHSLTATEVETVLIPGTDHLGLRAVLAGTR